MRPYEISKSVSGLLRDMEKKRKPGDAIKIIARHCDQWLQNYKQSKSTLIVQTIAKAHNNNLNRKSILPKGVFVCLSVGRIMQIQMV